MPRSRPALSLAILLALAPLSASPALAQSSNADAVNAGNAASDVSPDPGSYLPLTTDIRQTSLTALQETIYELSTLQHAAHQVHWNTIGIEFHQVHIFAENLYTSLAASIDMLGARMRSLGGPVAYAHGAIAAESGLEPLPDGELDAKAAFSELRRMYGAVSARLYERAEAVADDPGTHHLLVGTVNKVDKDLWMIRAHLTGSPQ